MSKKKLILNILFSLCLVFFLNNFINSQTKFAVIGDYGDRNSDESEQIANMIDTWNVDFILTLGENTYTNNTNLTLIENYDLDVGTNYHEWIKPYIGTQGAGSPDINRFFPTVGNHDYYVDNWGLTIQTYLDYFDLEDYDSTSGTETYYNVRWNDQVELFILDNYDGREPHSKDGGFFQPDGWWANEDSTSVQAQWLQTQMAASTAQFKIVSIHYPPYSSADAPSAGPTEAARWDFKGMGADVVFSANWGNYERLIVDSLTYVVNGVGGKALSSFGTPDPGSQVRILDYGAILAEINGSQISFQFFNKDGVLRDSYTLFEDTFAADSKNWNGGTDTDWNTALNWTRSGVPVIGDNVIIPSAPSNQPVISGTDANCLNLTIEPGATLTQNDKNLKIFGNWTNNGTFTAPSSGNKKVEFKGSSEQTIGGSSPTTFRGFKIDNISGVALNQSITVNEKLEFKNGQNGNLTTGSNTVTLGGLEGILTNEASGRYVVGNLIKTEAIGSSASSTLNAIGVSISAGSDDLGTVTVTRVSGIAPSGTGSILDRSWDISISGSQPFDGRTVTFSWASDDDGTVDITQAVVFKSTDAGTSWTAASATGGQDVSATRSIDAVGVTSFSLWTVSDATAPLPVELTSFSAIIKDKSVILNWRTETEVNNYGFEVQRSVKKDNWDVLGFVEGHGNSNSPKFYYFTDTDIEKAGKCFYRLKQIDNDGTFEYSNVVSVEVGVPDNYYLSQNYPNPFNPLTMIDFTLPEKQLVSLSVYNTLGELVTELVNEERDAGSYSVSFDASNLPSGVYIYRIMTPGYSTNKKMILLK